MSDAKINRYLMIGSAADRAAYVPDPPTPAVGDPAHGYYWYETDTGRLYIWNGSAWDKVADPAAVLGPASVTADRIALFNGTTGKLIKDSGKTLATLTSDILAAVPVPGASSVVTSYGYLGAPIMADQDDYTLALADSGYMYYHVSGSTHTLTIPANASVAFPIGTVILIENENGAGNLSIAITSDTLRWGSSTGTRTLAANGSAVLKKMTSTLWRLTGTGIT